MEKKLPKVFVNDFEKEIRNNETVYYANKKANETSPHESKVTTKVAKGKVNIDIKRKINAIFNSSNYIYKADVDITLPDGTFKKRIVGRNDKSLITIDDELIPIDSVVDIDFSN